MLSKSFIGLCCFCMVAGCADGSSSSNGSSKSSKDDDSSRVLHLPFEDSGTTTSDPNRDITLDIDYVFNEAVNKPSSDPIRKPGINGTALLFDGYSTRAHTDSFSAPTEEITVSCWVAPRTYNNGWDSKLTTLIGQQYGSSGFALGMYRYGKWCFQVGTTKGYYEVWDNGNPLPLYEWTFVSGTYSSKTGRLSIFMDGEEVNTVDVGIGYPINYVSDMELVIGQNNEPSILYDNTTNTFSGLIDEVSIHNKALTANDARELAGRFSKKDIDIYHDLWLDPSVLQDDRWKPQFHLSVPENWMNELYGGFYYNGKYHMFCQQSPNGPYIYGSCWGHFVSSDLVKWKNIVPAMIPEENGIDDDNVYSGSVAIDKDGKPVAFYTGVDNDSYYLNQISTARPSDLNDESLTAWTKSGTRLIEQESLSTYNNFRDPFIYQEGDYYFMFIGAHDNASGNGAVYCYRSSDLNDWEYMGISFSGSKEKYPYLGYMYELPTFYKVRNASGTIEKYMMMLAPLPDEGGINNVYYWLGDFNPSTGKFIPESDEPRQIDYGHRYLIAPSGFYDTENDRNIMVALAHGQLTNAQNSKLGYANSGTLLRELWLDDSGLLLVKPLPEMETLHKEKVFSIENVSISEANSALADIKGDQLHIKLELDPSSATELGIYVRKSKSNQERTYIGYNTNSRLLKMDTTKAGINQPTKSLDYGEVDIGNENIKLDIYLDHSLIEGFLNDRNSVTCYAYTSLDDSNGMLLYANSTKGKVVKMEVFSMENAWD